MTMSHILQHVEKLTENDLRSESARLVGVTRKHTAELIAHLAEISRRRAFLPSHASLWSYCVNELGLSEGEVSVRIQVANVCRRFPELLEALHANRLSLTVAARLAPHLTEQNAARFLEECAGMTRRRVEEYLVRWKPACEVSPGIRRSAGRALTHDASAPNGASSPRASTPSRTLPPPKPHRSSRRVEPVTPEVFNFRFPASAAFKRKLERLAEVLGVVDVAGNLSRLLEIAVDAALETRDPQKKLERRRVREAKRAAARAEEAAPKVDASRPDEVATALPASADRSRYIPSAIRERVLERAGFQCEFVGPDGRRCPERTGVQIDHIVPHARFGPGKASNLRCLCGPHNRWAAERVFGVTFVRARIAEARAKPSGGILG